MIMIMDGELDFDDDELIDDVPQGQEPTQPIDDDLTKDVLSLQGITDLNKIKFEDETGAIIERSWDSLSREEQLNILTNQQETQSEDESEEEDTSSSKTAEQTNAQLSGHEIEESIINSMIGAVNIFIDSINNYLTRFPKLRTEEKYRVQTKEIMMALKNYINDVEGALK